MLNYETNLFYISTKDLAEWIEKNDLKTKKFVEVKLRWKREKDKEPNFFSDTELLLEHQDIVLLKVINNNHAFFLAKNYQLEHQSICQKLFQEKKNIIIISEEQWKCWEKKEGQLIVLFKNKEIIKNSLEKWLKKLKNF
ncbi:hypothetical protein [endosymbiont GvMRE of Glomus versiforme]|uniref:hypothetical protein n=1 Tax=endosymbiont GvMRE of Glomus versiforme TaxID=2039283 RepID=UPI000ECA659F|nr:hypothetical protein [endosymbiont GvMRE of Glomus versiforme]RHZ35696.1 hypothetical protein GvMRE_IIg108 [endosymbiont GvMRE of Glomus versiforme]